MTQTFSLKRLLIAMAAFGVLFALMRPLSSLTTVAALCSGLAVFGLVLFLTRRSIIFAVVVGASAAAGAFWGPDNLPFLFRGRETGAYIMDDGQFVYYVILGVVIFSVTSMVWLRCLFIFVEWIRQPT